MCNCLYNQKIVLETVKISVFSKSIKLGDKLQFGARKESFFGKQQLICLKTPTYIEKTLKFGTKVSNIVSNSLKNYNQLIQGFEPASCGVRIVVTTYICFIQDAKKCAERNLYDKCKFCKRKNARLQRIFFSNLFSK